LQKAIGILEWDPLNMENGEEILVKALLEIA
jgi:hypothetical protein